MFEAVKCNAMLPTGHRAFPTHVACSAGVADDEDCTFSPALNPESERLLLDATNLPGSFHERQRHFERAKALKLQTLQSELVRLNLRV